MRKLTEQQQIMAEENMGLPHKAAQVFLRNAPYQYRRYKDDIIQAAMVGLCYATTTYDPEKAAFSTWAWGYMMQNIRNLNFNTIYRPAKVKFDGKLHDELCCGRMDDGYLKDGDGLFDRWSVDPADPEFETLEVLDRIDAFAEARIAKSKPGRERERSEKALHAWRGRRKGLSWKEIARTRSGFYEQYRIEFERLVRIVSEDMER